MLHIYQIVDSVSDDVLDKQLGALGRKHLLGTLSLDEHKILDRFFQDPCSFDLPFFEDTRLHSTQVKIMLDEFQYYKDFQGVVGCKESRAFQKLADILETAVEKGVGIVAICD